MQAHASANEQKLIEMSFGANANLFRDKLGTAENSAKKISAPFQIKKSPGEITSSRLNKISGPLKRIDDNLRTPSVASASINNSNQKSVGSSYNWQLQPKLAEYKKSENHYLDSRS